MTKLFCAILGASLSIAGAAYAGDATTSTSTSTRTTQAWSDAKVSAATSKCSGLTGTEAARCVVNIRPEGGGGSSVATAVTAENVVRAGVPTEEEYMSAMKHCDSADVADKDRCMADVKDRYGRM
jgi:hypothetical protein